jgi:predicted ATPase
MPGYILTGTPGAGKTAILRQLELNGHTVIEEAATDVISLQHALGQPEPWRKLDLIDDILALQLRRQAAAPVDARAATFFDRSPVCTLALSRFVGRAPSRRLLDEVDRLVVHRLCERTVFFVRNQGFVQATAARRISFEDSLVFERAHEQTYRELGFELIDIPAAALPVRVATIERTIARAGRPS